MDLRPQVKEKTPEKNGVTIAAMGIGRNSTKKGFGFHSYMKTGLSFLLFVAQVFIIFF